MQYRTAPIGHGDIRVAISSTGDPNAVTPKQHPRPRRRPSEGARSCVGLYPIRIRAAHLRLGRLRLGPGGLVYDESHHPIYAVGDVGRTAYVVIVTPEGPSRDSSSNSSLSNSFILLSGEPARPAFHGTLATARRMQFLKVTEVRIGSMRQEIRECRRT